mmetsp:Transcript_10088/g.20422  ORF Transcript_10088/g.20422 Transcript_10088/m.20422 type:complete len:345 (+) Transcript_10088:206-1240(+)
MCTITEHCGTWTMNIESDKLLLSSGPTNTTQRLDRNDDSVDSRDISLRNGMAPEELPKGYRPRPADVCCGRGKKNWRHHGNATFRRLIHSNVQAYIDATTKHDKTLVVKSIVDIVRSNGGRFLKQASDGGWHDIGDSQAREKVGHSLRDQVTALTKQKKDPSSTTTPRRSSSSSFSPYSSQRPLVGRSRSMTLSSPPSASPLNIMSHLPTDLSGVLEHIHFPSIQSSGGPPSAPHALETSSTSFSTLAHQSFNASSSQSFHASLPNLQHHHHPNASSRQSLHASFSSASQAQPQHHGSSGNNSMINFFHPLDDAMEPTPIREVFGDDYTPPPDVPESQYYPHSR